MNFQRKILNLVSKIPRGKVTTYKKLAEAIGKPKAQRAVGNALAKNPKPKKIPCHRVVKSNGKIGNYTHGKKKKEKLLQDEGVEIEKGKINLEKHIFDDF